MAVAGVVTLVLLAVSATDGRWSTSLPVTHSYTSRTRKSVAQRSFRHPPASGGNVMIELLERQKKLTANQWKLICTANLADLLDFFDFFLIGYVTAALTKQWSLTYWEGGAILLASGLGA